MRSASDILKDFPLGTNFKEQSDRESYILNQVNSGNFPDYFGYLWIPVVKLAKDKNGIEHELVIFVSPRHFELGVEGDSFLTPMWPKTAQAVADKFDSILPSRLIVDYIWEASGDNKIQIGPPKGFVIPGPDMERTPSWIAHNKVIQEKLNGLDLYSGGKKDVVVGPGLNGSKVAIYSGPFNPKGKLREYSGGIPLHQPYSTIHDSKYSDYSHGVRLVKKIASLDGESVNLLDIFKDPILSSIVSDQGPFNPVFPNSEFRTGLSAQEDSSSKTPSVDPSEPISEDKSYLIKWAVPAGLAFGIFAATLNAEKIRRWLYL